VSRASPIRQVLLSKCITGPSMSIESLLDSTVLKDDLVKVNKELGISASGSKAELIKALLAATKGSPTNTLDAFNKEVLKDICRKIGSSPSGTKAEIIKRIYDKELRP